MPGSRLAAAQQVEQVGGLTDARAEPLHDVLHRGVAVAQRAVVVPVRQGSSTGAGSSMVCSSVRSAAAGASRSWVAEMSAPAPASRL